MTRSARRVSPLAAAIACSLAVASCKKESAASGKHGATSEQENAASEQATTANEQPSRESGEQTAAGGEHSASIDCPLRKQGIDPSHLRPFEEVEKYIAFLERPDRAEWQKPDDVIAALHLAGGETVVDLGAGSGYFSFRLAKALPRGRVIAADIEPEMIRHIHHKAMAEDVKNIEAELIPADAPSVPRGADLVFVCDVVHHVPDRAAWLAEIAKAMSSGAKLVLIEFKEGDLPEGPPESVKIPHDELVKLVTDAGLVLAEDRPELLPYQTFLVFRKP